MPHVIDSRACTACGACEAECPVGAIALVEGGEVCAIDPAECTDCGDCVEVCPAEAIAPAP